MHVNRTVALCHVKPCKIQSTRWICAQDFSICAKHSAVRQPHAFFLVSHPMYCFPVVHLIFSCNLQVVKVVAKPCSSTYFTHRRVFTSLGKCYCMCEKQLYKVFCSTKGSCLKSDTLPQVMSFKAALFAAEVRVVFPDLQPTFHLCLRLVAEGYQPHFNTQISH